MRLIHFYAVVCLSVFGLNALASPLDDSTLADQVLAIIGARVPNSTNKCAGCHHLDANKLRAWFSETDRVEKQCFQQNAEADLNCLSVNKAIPYQFGPKALGLWAARVNSEDFTPIFKEKYAGKYQRELNKFRQRTYMPRSGAPGFTDEQWALVKEYVDRGAPLLDQKLSAPVQQARPTPASVEDTVVVQDLSSPWAVVPSPDGQIWITQQSGEIKIYDTSFKLLKTLQDFATDLEEVGQGGMLDLAFHPKFLQNGWVYIAYTVQQPTGYGTQINRFTYRDGQLGERKIILNGPTGTDSAHFGCRLVFDDKGYLYASFGERHQKEKAQSKDSLHGKTVRLNDDGSIPVDNPFPNNAIYTLGHRNPQGLAIHPLSKALVVSEHGPTGYDAPGGGDEVNILKPGANYGWPIIHHRQTKAGMESPLAEWTPAIAPSGIVFYTADKIPQWKNDLFIATLAGSALYRLTIDANGQLKNQEVLLENKYGRLRDVAQSPDGTLLVVSDGGQLIQLRPR